ncbi:MAG: hypothetical protein ACYCTE_07115, partial [Acidimicrobiales bacterium]
MSDLDHLSVGSNVGEDRPLRTERLEELLDVRQDRVLRPAQSRRGDKSGDLEAHVLEPGELAHADPRAIGRPGHRLRRSVSRTTICPATCDDQS